MPRPDGPPAAAASPGSAGLPPQPSHDAARRAFFLQFGRHAATAVGQVTGVADLVGRGSSAMARGLPGLGSAPGSAPGGTPGEAFVRGRPPADPVGAEAVPAGEDVFRSAYRLDDDALVILDQRRIPEALEQVRARRGADVAYYLRLGVARGGSLMAQLAAYGLALTAAERIGQPADQLAGELARTARALVEARPSARAVAWAVERMQAAAADDAAGGGGRLASRLRAEADAIATELTAAESAIAAALVEELQVTGSQPLRVLLHGDHGALAGGQLGAGFAALAGLRAAGRDVRVFVTEGRPFMDGARLACWELRQAGIEHRLIGDSAAAWLLQREPIDLVLLRAERVAANGDVAGLVGARGLAQLAQAAVGSGAPPARPRVVVTAPSAALDGATPDGSAMPLELRPAHELAAYLEGVPVRASDALVPATDVVPAALVDLLLTEQGRGPQGS